MTALANEFGRDKIRSIRVAGMSARTNTWRDPLLGRTRKARTLKVDSVARLWSYPTLNKGRANKKSGRMLKKTHQVRWRRCTKSGNTG
jgi:hypothetical protein